MGWLTRMLSYFKAIVCKPNDGLQAADGPVLYFGELQRWTLTLQAELEEVNL